MDESANWMDYPHETQKDDDDMQQGSTSSMREFSSTHPDPSSIVPTAEKITPIEICSERTNKRDFSDAMDAEEEDTAKTPKKQKIEETGQIIQVAYVKCKNKHMKFRGAIGNMANVDCVDCH